MIAYFLKMLVCQALLLGFYNIFLKSEPIFKFNRFFLLLSLSLGFILPLISIEVPTFFVHKSFGLQNYAITSSSLENIISNERVSNTMPEAGYNIWHIIYIAIVIILLVRFLINLTKIIHIIHTGEKELSAGYSIVYSKKIEVPCSFFNHIFFNSKSQMAPMIMIHEQWHVKKWHSLDIVLVELAQIFFWINPIMFFYKSAIKLNHEFEADAFTMAKINEPADYQNLILSFVGLPAQSLYSNLNFQITKNRIIMMTKSKPTQLASLKAIISLFIVALSFGLFSEISFGQETLPSEKPKNIKSTKKAAIVFAKEDVDYKNGTYFIAVDENKREKNKRYFSLKYSDLNDFDKSKIGNPLVWKRESPTNEMMANWLIPSNVGLWINEKKVKNSELNKFKKEDFAHYTVSKLAKNAKYAKQYKYQVDVMTNKYYDEIYLENFKKAPFFVIELRTQK